MGGPYAPIHCQQPTCFRQKKWLVWLHHIRGNQCGRGHGSVQARRQPQHADACHRQAATAGLEILLIKIHSAVDAAEKHDVENAWLLQWRDKLKEAAAAGDEVFASLKQRGMDVQTITIYTL